jgi:hypothetical protein
MVSERQIRANVKKMCLIVIAKKIGVLKIRKTQQTERITHLFRIRKEYNLNLDHD